MGTGEAGSGRITAGVDDVHIRALIRGRAHGTLRDAALKKGLGREGNYRRGAAPAAAACIAVCSAGVDTALILVLPTLRLAAHWRRGRCGGGQGHGGAFITVIFAPTIPVHPQLLLSLQRGVGDRVLRDRARGAMALDAGRFPTCQAHCPFVATAVLLLAASDDALVAGPAAAIAPGRLPANLTRTPAAWPGMLPRCPEESVNSNLPGGNPDVVHFLGKSPNPPQIHQTDTSRS